MGTLVPHATSLFVPILASAVAIVAAVAGFVVFGIFAAKAGHKRREEILAWAAENGFQYDVGKFRDIEDRFRAFSCFSTGNNRYARDLMHAARDNRYVTCFDYHYETTTTNSKGHRQTHHHWSSNIVIDVGWPLEPLSIRSEHFFDKITQAMGFDDIDFESNEFSRAFHVKAPNRRWAFDVISTETMEILLASPRFALEMGGAHLLVRRNSRMNAQAYAEGLALGMAVLDAIPADVAAARSKGTHLA